VEGAALDVEIQCELDAAMTVRELPLDRQGFPESYMAATSMSHHTEHAGGSSEVGKHPPTDQSLAPAPLTETVPEVGFV